MEGPYSIIRPQPKIFKSLALDTPITMPNFKYIESYLVENAICVLQKALSLLLCSAVYSVLRECAIGA